MNQDLSRAVCYLESSEIRSSVLSSMGGELLKWLSAIIRKLCFHQGTSIDLIILVCA